MLTDYSFKKIIFLFSPEKNDQEGDQKLKINFVRPKWKKCVGGYITYVCVYVCMGAC